MSDNTPYHLAFSHCFGIGPMKFSALMKRFGSAQEAYGAQEKDLQEIIGSYATCQFLTFRSEFDPGKKLGELTNKRISIVTREDKRFPNQLLTIPDPPICLYVKGNIENFNFSQNYCMAVVGTRKPTSYGQQIARTFVFDLVTAGFVVVSGMALGIDTIAHQTTLEAQGKTIAVLGCGVDIVYPQANFKLYDQIIKSGGLVLSEFPPGHRVLKGLFISRNRIISGLSKGVLVVEGAADSGGLITARFAAEQGKEVFAPPGPLTSQMSQAPNLLLKQGARLITSIDDILAEFNLKIYPKRKDMIRSQLSGEEKNIFDVLTQEPIRVDDLVISTKLTLEKILSILSSLEIKGVIEKNSEGKYQLRMQPTNAP